jgi:hypothetical protein
MQGVLPPYRRICGPHFGIDPRVPQKRTCIGGSSASFAVSLEDYDIQMGIATGISAQGLGPSPSLPAAGPQRALFPLNNKRADHVGDRRKGPCRRVAAHGGREQRSRKQGFDEARAPEPCFRWSLECRSVPANMVGIMCDATQRPLDVVSGGSTQIVVGPKWRGHRADSIPIPAGQHSCLGLAVSRAPS